MVRDQEMTIVTAGDDGYVVALAACLKSIELNLKVCMPCVVYIVDGGLSAKHRALLKNTVSKDLVRLSFLSPPHAEALEGVPLFGHVNINTYFRVMLPLILPGDCSKAIYLDADTLVLGDISCLWLESMEGFPLMAVQDGSATMESARIPEFRELGISSDAKVLNGGVLVIDVDAWRKDGAAAAIVEYLRRNRDNVRYWDQDGINAIFAERWKPMDYRWNYRIDCSVPLPLAVSPSEYLAEVRQQARIVHFSSATKPWGYYTDHPGKELFCEFLRKTWMVNWQPRPPLRALTNRHYWGAKLRRFPGVGPAWRMLRARSS